MSKKKSTKSMAQQIQVLSGKMGKLTQENSKLNQQNSKLNQQKNRLSARNKDYYNIIIRLESKANGKVAELIKNAAYKPVEKPKSILITIDGTNGAGKTTLIENLLGIFKNTGFTDYDRIKESELAPPEFKPLREGAKTKLDYPNDRIREASIGRLVTNGRITSGTTNLLYRLQENKIVILDRYIWTTVAYQLSAGTSIDEAISFAEGSFIIPDYSLILIADPEIGRDRSVERSIKTGRKIESTKEISKKVEGYEKLYSIISENFPKGYMDLIDTTNIPEKEVAMTFITNALTKYLEPDITNKMIEYINLNSNNNNGKNIEERVRASA